MGIFRRRRDTGSPAERRGEFSAFGESFAVESKVHSGSIEDSDVFVCRHVVTPIAVVEPEPTRSAVTLFVYGWHVVEPGTLSWVFPNIRAALAAVRTMRNATQWCIANGTNFEDLEAARAANAVLVEQLI